MNLDVVKEFKHLPSTLGIKNKKSHFDFLTQIINEKIREFSKELQLSFNLLMTSFKTKYQTDNVEYSKFKKIQQLFLSNQKYRESLKELIYRVKLHFNMIN